MSHCRTPIPIASRRAHGRAIAHTVRAAAAGDGGAWSDVVQAYGPRVRSATRAHRLGAHDAEDVEQSTWLKLIENVHGIREPAAIGAWLETTARHESVRLLRKAGRECLAGEDALDCHGVEPVAEQRVAQGQARAALVAAMRDLPDRQRGVIAMTFAEPAPSYEEISRQLGIPIGSIGPTRARGLERLRDDARLRTAATALLEDS